MILSRRCHCLELDELVNISGTIFIPSFAFILDVNDLLDVDESTQFRRSLTLAIHRRDNIQTSTMPFISSALAARSAASRRAAIAADSASISVDSQKEPYQEIGRIIHQLSSTAKRLRKTLSHLCPHCLTNCSVSLDPSPTSSI